MGLVFKKEQIDLILQGIKTQTYQQHRRPLKKDRIYDVKRDLFHSTAHKILIVRAFRQRLGGHNA